MSHIFISYSRKDLPRAGKIVAALAENKLDTWIDWKSIPKGEIWEQEIYRGIEEADAFLFLISPDSVTSDMCNKEIEHALANNKRILPVVVRDTELQDIHPELSKRNWAFCRSRQDDFGKAIRGIRKAIRTDYGWVRYHTELQVKALKWEQKRDPGRLLRRKELREAEEQSAEINNLKEPQPTKLQREYVLASRRYEDQQRKQLTIVLALGFVAMLVLAIAAVQQRNVAVSQRATAQAASTLAVAQELTAQASEYDTKRQLLIAESRRLAAEARRNIAARYDLAALLSVESTRKADTAEARDVLIEGVKNNLDAYYLPWPTPNVTSLALGSEGNLLVVAYCMHYDTHGKCQDAEIRFWTIPQRENIGKALRVHGEITDLLLSPDQRTLVGNTCVRTYEFDDTFGHCRREIWIWDIKTYKVLASSLLARDRYPIGMAFTPDGKALLLGYCDNDPLTIDQAVNRGDCGQGKIRIWSIQDRQDVGLVLALAGVPYQIAFHPTNEQIIAVSVCDDYSEENEDYCDTGSIQIWNIKEGRLITSAEIHNLITSLSFVDESSLIVGKCFYSHYGFETCSVDLGTLSSTYSELNVRVFQELEQNEYIESAYCSGPNCGSGRDELIVVADSAIYSWYTSSDTGEQFNWISEIENYNAAAINYPKGFLALALDLLPPFESFSGCSMGCSLVRVFPVWNNASDMLKRTSLSENISENVDVACDIAGRNFTQVEWAQYFPDEPYRLTCPQWPAGE